MKDDARLALSRVNLRDSAVMPQTADQFVSNLAQFAGTDQSKAPAFEDAVFASLESAYGFDRSSSDDRKPFVYQDGFAIIPIHGALLNRFGGSWGFVTGYQAIRRQMNAALEDDDVEMIVFDVDSPGGEVAGCFELAEEIRASRTIKPSIAVVDALSASAGYALSSAATQMAATPSSKIGSIGIISMHIDVTGALDQAGIKITMIESPKDGMKTAGSPYRPLDGESEKYFQSFTDAAYDTFVNLIVENRGLSDEIVRQTDARVFRADEALAIGLIDAVKTPSEAVSSFLAELADDDPTEGEDEDMKIAKPGTEATSEAPAAAPAAAAPAAATPAPAAPAADNTAIQAAIREDRERMAAIKALPDAAKLPKFADHLATAGYTVDEAKSSLAAAVADLPETPAAAAPAPAAAAPGVDETNHLDTAMNNTDHPNVGAGVDTGGAPGVVKSDADVSAQILGDYAGVTGRKYGEQPAA
jgi:signal peptide peptidase SppA